MSDDVGSAEPRRTVLLIEDDRDLRMTLSVILEDEGMTVEGHPTGEAALARMDLLDPDVVLVDLGLPGMSGFDVVAAIRERSDIPVVILTARGDSADVVAGLGAGADDYVTKPFVVGELVARLRAHLRRAPSGPEAVGEVQVGELRLSPRRGEATVRGAAVHLTKTELRVLLTLAGAAGDVVSREQLLARVWRYDYLGDSRMVDAQIRRIRLKIEADPANPQMLVTVRGAGYRLVGSSDSSEA
ncbi:MAG: response regulator transcription factor [Actinomycetota bacterium]|nr:response regulator transcription factor [Actinomycetota bacterium]